ncbi:polysaccharide biosynthesis/export family protein [soil metagenome]
MKVNFLLVFVLVISLFQLVLGQQVPPTVEQQKGYLIGPGDEIEGKIQGEEQFNFKATIDENGKFQVPFVDNGVMAKCRTENDLKKDVTQLLSKYLKSPLVSVNVTKRNRPPVMVYGEVRNPQPVGVYRKATLLELLSVAGGATKDAGGTVQVFRPTPPLCDDANEAAHWKPESDDSADIPSRIYTISNLKSGEEEANPIIYPGDLIFVKKAPPVYVIGEVNALREISITEKGLSLMEAISQAGGVNREAKTKNIIIHRLKDNSKDRELIAVNYDLIKKGKENDVILQPEDIIVVDKAKKSIGQTILEIATGSVRSFSNVLPQRVLY